MEARTQHAGTGGVGVGGGGAKRLLSLGAQCALVSVPTTFVRTSHWDQGREHGPLRKGLHKSQVDPPEARSWKEHRPFVGGFH